MARARSYRWVLPGLWALVAAGCTTVPNTWPFVAVDRTDYRTPAMRIDAISEFAAQSTGLDTPEQREITDQLARQIQIEPDPLVRRAIIRSVAQFRTPLAQQVLLAGLGDREAAVRLQCCRSLGERGDVSAVEPLAAILKQDENVDVKLAAVDALGNMHSSEAIEVLAFALDSPNPAMQYAGVESLKSISGRDYGGDVRAWKQFASGGQPAVAEQPEISVAERLRRLTPF